MPSRVGRGRRDAVDFVVCFGWGGFFRVFFFSNAHGLLHVPMMPPCLIYLSTSTDCEGCTRPLSTNPGSMEAGEYGLTRGTCSVASRLEVVAVAGLLWISCVFFPFFFFERTRPSASIRSPCLVHLSTSTAYSIAAAENVNFTKNNGRKIVQYRSVIKPVRPLKIPH